MLLGERKSMRFPLAILALSFLLGAAAPVSAATPPPNAQAANVAITGWKLECDPVKATLACRAMDQILAQNGALVLSFMLADDAAGKTVLTINTPLGISVKTPVGVSVAGSATQSFPFLTCSQAGCFATGPVNADLLAAMRGAKSDLKVTYDVLDTGLNERAVTATLSLTGFAAVADRLKQ